MHCEVELGVVVIYGRYQFAYFYFGGKFFLYLASQGFLRTFPWLYLSAGKFPPVLPLTISSLRGEYLAVLTDYGGDYLYVLLSFHSCMFTR